MKKFLISLIVVLTASPVGGEPPSYGGELNIGTVVVTLSALSWDPADWTWKSNHDVGNVREQLFAGDLSKSIRKGGIYSCLLYTSPSPRDVEESRMPSSA